MKQRRVPVILATLVTVAWVVRVVAQTPAPSRQSDPNRAQTVTQSEPSAQAERPSTSTIPFL